MTFHSILFEKSEDTLKKETPEAPAFFTDLNLDQVVDAITAGKQEYNLKPFFYTPLRDVAALLYRHEIMRDLEDESLLEHINSFAQKMSVVRRYLALVDKLDFNYHKKSWFLDAAKVYCEAIDGLVHDLSLADLKSRGLSAFRAYVTSYANSHSFKSLTAETNELKTRLSTVKYCVIIKYNTVKVRKYESETDYSVEVEKTFEKFKQGAVKDYRIPLYRGSGMNHVEAQILEFVARLYPDIFAGLDSLYEQHSHFLDETIRNFDREIQFYVAYLQHAAKIKQAGLKFCYPEITITSKEVYDYEGFDIALANKRISENAPVVCNDFSLQDPERILVVSGPNQGGKTTFARTFGQLHYLAGLGCLVPGRQARLFLYDQLFTHFEKEENIQNLRGKLEDDLARIHAIMDRATPNSLIIMNEIFSSTTLKDAIFLSKAIMGRIIQLDLLCVWVTFIDEMASFSEKTVSMVSMVVPENPAERTYKVIRKPADGLAYAISIAEKYHITYEQIMERIKP